MEVDLWSSMIEIGRWWRWLARDESR